MKLFFVISFFSLFIFLSCVGGSGSEKSREEILLAAHDSLQAVKIQQDELSDKVLELMTAIDEQKYLVHYWVNEQSRSDSQEKARLIILEEQSKDILSDLEPMMKTDEYKKCFAEVSVGLDELLIITGEIKGLLASFEDYEDLTKLFIAELLIAVDGDYEMAFNKLIRSIESLYTIAKRDVEETEIKLEMNELDSKKNP